MVTSTTYSRFIASQLNPSHSELAWQWLNSEVESKIVLDTLHPEMYGSSKNRYRFIGSTQAAAAKAVFEVAFKRAPDQVIAAAEATAGTSFYPLWKRVAKIYLPQFIGTVTGDTLFKIGLIIATGYLNYKAGYLAYEATQHFVGARAVPYIINNTPIEVIRVFNRAIDSLQQAYRHVYNNRIRILFYTWTIQWGILLGPEIPYFTAAVRAISVWSLFKVLTNSPQTIGVFLFGIFMNEGLFVWNTCTDISQFFLQIAEKGKAERLMVSKERAQALWLRDMGPRLTLT